MFADQLSPILLRAGWSVPPAPFHQGSLFSCLFGDTDFEPHIRRVSVHTATCAFAILLTAAPSQAVVFCSPWCLALSQTLGQLSPPLSHLKSFCHCQAGFRRGDGLGRPHFPSLSQPQFLIAPLNKAVGCNMFYSGFEVDQRKCLWVTKGEGSKTLFPYIPFV